MRRYRIMLFFAVFLIPGSATRTRADEVGERIDHLAGMGRYGTARAIAESVLERTPDRPDLWFRLARVCERQGDIGGAVDAFRRGQEYGPLPRAAEWLARYFYKTGHTRLAIREAVRGLDASP